MNKTYFMKLAAVSVSYAIKEAIKAGISRTMVEVWARGFVASK